MIAVEARVRARDWSLNEAFGEDGSLSGLEMLEDDSPDQETLLIEGETESKVGQAIEEGLQKLDQRERFVINKRFFEETPWTLQEIGNHFGTSRERIRQLEKRALTKLKAYFASDLQDYLVPA